MSKKPQKPKKVENDAELLELIHLDLKMRSCNGVVPISDFIWERLEKRLNKR